MNEHIKASWIRKFSHVGVACYDHDHNHDHDHEQYDVVAQSEPPPMDIRLNRSPGSSSRSKAR
ncbi:hypothetical protein P175DRAFT_0501699 [Aspergillus ochraceoroseus IBT 24754]|uniref:Uncharacterized protein n=1 Tax=Aspergillus ochraceoroseus IBT 24754 TaxID=1392256 RepID=A0A2T5LXR5_9EURO|nr:uncharacterized protein P175DRAFT_0501699 [Aspergillus ochraceoroseus IBT 24754]PTU21070.1 hypothetical protein P175DRAFT_0501699 [Aspergillus ochraceoroseus IBT 24754]